MLEPLTTPRAVLPSSVIHILCSITGHRQSLPRQITSTGSAQPAEATSSDPRSLCPRLPERNPGRLQVLPHANPPALSLTGSPFLEDDVADSCCESRSYHPPPWLQTWPAPPSGWLSRTAGSSWPRSPTQPQTGKQELLAQATAAPGRVLIPSDVQQPQEGVGEFGTFFNTPYILI